MAAALVGVVLGSRSDFNIMRRGLESLRVMGVPYVLEISSPHRTPDRLMKFAAGASGRGIEVIICAAGGSAQVAGFIACYTIVPVVAVPIDSTPLRGEDALLGTVQSPPGVPVAAVGINNGENAALLATQILAIKYPKYRDVLRHGRQAAAQKLEVSMKELLAEYPDLCDPDKTAPSHLRATTTDEETDPGPEDVTPTPPTGIETKDAIRPGATLSTEPVTPPPVQVPVAPSASPALAPASARAAAGKLVSTPLPQEPGTVTEDHTLKEDTPQPGAVVAKPESDLPPPPRISDLTPLSLLNTLVTPVEAALRGAPARKTPSSPENPTLKSAPASDGKAPRRSTEPDGPTLDTKIFELDAENPDEDVLTHAMMVVLEGGIVAFPTDTVYGLAVDATNPEAVKHLYEVKGRSAKNKSLSVLVHDSAMLDSLVKEVPPVLESVLEKYWPGALTVLFVKHPTVLNSVSELPSIAIRIPNNPIALRLMEMVNRPLAVINASMADSPAAVDASQVVDRFSGRIDCVLNAGPCKAGEISTVLSVLSEPFEILREGAVPRRALKQLIGARLRD